MSFINSDFGNQLILKTEGWRKHAYVSWYYYTKDSPGTAGDLASTLLFVQMTVSAIDEGDIGVAFLVGTKPTRAANIQRA